MLALYIHMLKTKLTFLPSFPTESTGMVAGFKDFLDNLQQKQKFDHLRLPLQVSALLTPIVLLLGTSIHQSQNFCQRYRVMLVCANLLLDFKGKFSIVRSAVFQITWDRTSNFSGRP